MKIDMSDRHAFWSRAVQMASEALDRWQNVDGPRLASFGEHALARAAITRADEWLRTCIKQRDGWAEYERNNRK